MKLKILLNLGAGLPEWKEGQEVDCEDERLCELLLRRNWAANLTPEKVEIVEPKVSPPQPETEKPETENVASKKTKK